MPEEATDVRPTEVPFSVQPRLVPDHARTAWAGVMRALALEPKVITCTACHDEGACEEHSMRRDPVGANVHCARCGGTGEFITGSLNGKLVGPGGACYRCDGKGYHTRADRRRNWKHSQCVIDKL